MPFSKPAMITKALVGVALCFATAPAAYANACQAGSNCVFPVTDAPPPPPVAAPVAFVEERGGLGILPIIAGLALAALVAYLLLDGDDDEDEEVPVSP